MADDNRTRLPAGRGVQLLQLRCLVAIAQSGMSITAAARALHTSQPGVSKQLRLLEEEVGQPLFERDGRHLLKLTGAGEAVMEHALVAIAETDGIRRLGSITANRAHGSLSIGTTYTQARYILPSLLQRLRAMYPEVTLHLRQGPTEQLSDIVQLQGIDCALATGSQSSIAGMVVLPCYRWHRRVVVPKGHPLTQAGPLTLELLAQYPIVTYVFSFKGSSSLLATFARAGIAPQIALTARDADVIKTYVKLGMGVGIIASVAVDSGLDPELDSLDVSHLFAAHTTYVAFRQGTLLTGFMYDFFQLLAPHLSRKRIQDALRMHEQRKIDALFSGAQLPTL